MPCGGCARRREAIKTAWHRVRGLMSNDRDGPLALWRLAKHEQAKRLREPRGTLTFRTRRPF